jgi:cell division protein FtsI (penicillin-binding protein 3)
VNACLRLLGSLLPRSGRGAPATSAAADLRRRERAAWMGVAVVTIFGLLLGKLFFLQIVDGPRLKRLYEQQHVRPVPETLTPVGLRIPLAERPSRGTFIDREGRVLASSYYEHRLYYDPSAWGSEVHGCTFEDFVEELPNLLKSEGVRIDKAELAKKLARTSTREGRPVREVLLARNVSPGARRRLSETFKDACWRGLFFRDQVARKYPCGEATAQVVGIVGESEEDADGAVSGRTGLEWQLDDLLAGRRGVFGGERDSMGREFRFEQSFVVPPVGGAEVRLTIDAEISRICLEALARNAKPHPCVRSSAVVLSAQTGEVLAAVSYPASPPEGPGFNAKHLALAAVGDSYEPGSTIKPVVVGWGMEKGYIHGDQLFDCGGADGIETFFNRTVQEYSINPQALTPAQILWRSSNVGATRIGLERLKLSGLFQAFRAFHVADRPRSGLPNEAAGYFTPEKSEPDRGIVGATEAGAGVSFPRGYEVRVSPLGLALLYTTFATGGWRLEPTVIREARVGENVLTPPPAKRTRVLSREACDYVREAMLQAYENPRGTAYSSARSTKYSAMGKTGTAQYADKHTARGTQYNAWIVGMAPAKDPDDPSKTRDPEILVVVVHHRVPARGKGTYTGGVVSGPVLKEIVERTLEHLGVEPDQPTPVEEGPK